MISFIRLEKIVGAHKISGFKVIAVLGPPRTGKSTLIGAIRCRSELPDDGNGDCAGEPNLLYVSLPNYHPTPAVNGFGARLTGSRPRLRMVTRK